MENLEREKEKELSAEEADLIRRSNKKAKRAITGSPADDGTVIGIEEMETYIMTPEKTILEGEKGPNVSYRSVARGSMALRRNKVNQEIDEEDECSDDDREG